MDKCKEHPRYNVLSIRISDEEKAQMETIVKIAQRPMSDIMRDVIGMLARITQLEVGNGSVSGDGPFDGATFLRVSRSDADLGRDRRVDDRGSDHAGG